MDTGTFLVVEHVVSTAVEGAVLARIGLAQLTQVPCAKTTPFIILLLYSCRGTSTYSCGKKDKGGWGAGCSCVPALEKEGNSQVHSARWAHGACTNWERITAYKVHMCSGARILAPAPYGRLRLPA